MPQARIRRIGAAAAVAVAAAFVTAIVAALPLASIGAPAAPPVAPVRPVVDDYYGTRVVDDYRYMENIADPEVQDWLKGQAQYARARLDALPGRAPLLARIHALRNGDLRRFDLQRRGARLFYQAVEPDAQLPKLYYRDGIDGAEHLLLDPGALAQGTATHYALDYYSPSWDGRYVAYGISAGGSEASVLHVIDLASGKALAEAIDRTSDSVVSWRPDSRSFFYLRYPKAGPDTSPAETEYNARTCLHLLGAPADGSADPIVFGRGVSRRVEVPEGQGTYVITAPDSGYAIAVANRNMDDNPSTLYLAPLAQVRGSNTPWRRIADVDDGVTAFRPHGSTLFFLSQKNASRFRLLATGLDHPDVRHARVVVPESAAVITGFAIAKDGLYLSRRDGALSRLARVAPGGGPLADVPLPFDGNVGGLVAGADAPGALFDVQGWVQPGRIVRFDPDRGATTDTGLLPPSTIDTSNLEAEEVFAVSYDGTRVPLSIIHRKGLALDGTHPTILRGYGSYGLALEPMFNATGVAWIERGGVLATAHLRGGGEYGEDWHRAGQLLSKPNTILDFIACGQYLVDALYTAPRLLAGLGGSAGGITAGGALTWRPDLFGVILDLVGVSDNLRSETEPNGPPNVPEFGSVKTEAGFHGLYAMSAYQHVRDGSSYPAVLFSTGANDPRVAPWQMAKMTARMQRANASGRPILLRVDFDAGHGIGSSAAQREAELADLWSFTLWQMGDPEFQPAPQP